MGVVEWLADVTAGGIVANLLWSAGARKLGRLEREAGRTTLRCEITGDAGSGYLVMLYGRGRVVLERASARTMSEALEHMSRMTVAEITKGRKR
jgi:hypothetical protein